MTFTVRHVQAVSLNSGDAGTTQDFTVSGFGTPTAWIVSVCQPASLASVSSDAGLCVGWQEDEIPDTESMFFGAEDNTASAYASSAFGGGTGVIRMLAPGTTSVDMQATSATITDGVRITYSTKPTASRIIVVSLIECDDAAAGDHSSGTSVTGLTFEPTCVLTMNANGISSPTNGWRGGLGFGAQTTGGTISQGSWSQRFRTSANAPVNTGQIARDGSFATTLSSTFVESRYTLSSFNSDGFSFSLSGSTFGFSYLALRCSTKSFWAGWTASATSTGDQAVTSPGFGLGGGFITSTFLSSLDTVESTSENCSSGFHGWGEEEFSASVSIEDGSNPTQAASYASSNGLDVLSNAGSLALSGTLTGAGSGFSVNWTTVDGTARYFLMLGFQADDIQNSVDETMGISEEALGRTGQAIEETLGMSEEVVSLLIESPAMDVPMEGEGQYPQATGEGGCPRMVEGEGG